MNERERQRANDTLLALASLVVDVGVALYRPLVIVTGWLWFVVPLGAPVVNYAAAWGLTIVGRLAIGTATAGDAHKDPSIPGLEVLGQSIRDALGVAFAHLILWILLGYQ